MLRVQFGFQSVISAFLTDEQKNYTLNHETQTLSECRNMLQLFSDVDTAWPDLQRGWRSLK
jgi:hypothetical protein